MHVVIVDTNAAETPLFELLVARLGSRCVRRERLDIGDIAFGNTNHEDGSGCVQITHRYERKTWEDLVASIVDRRFKEQKQRWMGTEAATSGSESLAYLIEAPRLPPFDGVTRGVRNKATYAALLKTQLRDGIAVVWTAGGAMSASTLAYLHEQSAKGELQSTHRGGRGVVVGQSGGSTHKRKRTNLEDDEQVRAAMLTMLPGVTSVKAHSLLSQFGGSFAAIAASTEDALGKMHWNGTDGRRVGPAIAGRILSALK